jgi:hypothetical protein
MLGGVTRLTVPRGRSVSRLRKGKHVERSRDSKPSYS